MEKSIYSKERTVFSNSNVVKNHCVDMMLQFQQLREQKMFLDVTISVGGKHLSAHRLVLAAASPYFSALFNPRMKSGSFEIHKLDSFSFDALCILVDFAYCGELKVPGELLEDVIELANYLGMETALKICLGFAMNYLCLANAISFWFLGDIIQSVALKTQSLAFVVECFSDANQNDAEEMCTLPLSLVVDTFSSPALYMHRNGTLVTAQDLEVKVFEILLKWIDCDSVNRYTCLPLLLSTCIYWQCLNEKTCHDLCATLNSRLWAVPCNVGEEIKLFTSESLWRRRDEFTKCARFQSVKLTSGRSHGKYPYNRHTSSVVFHSDDVCVPARVVGMTLNARLWEGRPILAGLTVKYSDGKVHQHGLAPTNSNLCGSFDLDPDERIVEVLGSAEYFIDSLTFVSNTNKVYGPFCGRSGAGRFVDRPPQGHCGYLACVRGCEVMMHNSPAVADLEFVWGYVPLNGSSWL